MDDHLLPEQDHELSSGILSKIREKIGNEGDYESPALDAIHRWIDRMPHQRYTTQYLPEKGTYLGIHNKKYEQLREKGIAQDARIPNSMIQNLLHNADLASKGNTAPLIENGTTDSVAMIHAARKELESDSATYKSAGLLDKFYGASSNLDYYYRNAIAQTIKHLQKKDNQGDGNGVDDGDSNEPDSDEPGDGGQDTASKVKALIEYIQSLDEYFKLISQFIDRCVYTPAHRIQVSKIQDDEGDETEVVDLELDKLHKMSSDSLALVATNRQLAALVLDDLTMNERFIVESKKFIDVFVVDTSGSMCGEPLLRAAAFIYNRLEKVIKKQAMLALIVFDYSSTLYRLPKEMAGDKPSWLIDTPKKARYVQLKLYGFIKRHSGGGTNIPNGIREGKRLAYEMEKFGGVRPNITVVTDDDTSALQYHDNDIPINALALANNESMQSVCIRTGGYYNNLEQIITDLDLLKAQA